MKLRPYQQNGYETVLHEFDNGHRVVMLVIPTGGGKTVVFSKMVADWHEGSRCVVVHRKEILGQISLSLAAFGVKHRVIAPNNTVRSIRRRHLKKFGRSYVDDRAGSTVAVASVQTLASKRAMTEPLICRFVNSVKLGVFDEAHHYTNSGHWARAVERFNHSRLLMVTATPERADGKGLGSHASGYVDKMVVCRDEYGNEVDTRWLMNQGYLCTYRYFSPPTDFNVADVALTASGEFNAKALRARAVESHIVGDIAEQCKKYAPGKKTITFSIDVETAYEQTKELNAAGVPSVCLHGGTDPGERDREVERFSTSPDLQNLVNVDLFDEGFDVAGAEALAQGRATNSLAKFLQMVGRVLRPVYAPGYDLETREGRLAAIANSTKPYAIILDPVRNWERHGPPNYPREWTLDDVERGERSASSGTVAQRLCLECTQPYPAYLNPCPFCGAPVPLPDRSDAKKVDGDLEELDADALDAILARIDAANASRADKEQELINRHVPAIGRPRLLRLHEQAKQRRAVLKNLVGWWIGMQPADRTLNEKHRRFFHRFGVDIGTAFTLGLEDTDKLIQTIQSRFSADFKE